MLKVASLSIILVAATSSESIAADLFQPEAGRYRIESIDAFPDFVRGSATLHFGRMAGRDIYMGHVVGMKTFGFSLPEIPETITLSGKVFEEKLLGRTRERLGLVGMFTSEGRSCFLRLSARAPQSSDASAPREIYFAGWLDCGNTRVELGFSAEREKTTKG